MYGIYAISFIMMIFMISFSEAEKQNLELEDKSVSVAKQMIIWHRSAFKHCVENTCTTTGRILDRDVRDHLPTAGENSVAFNNGLFRATTTARITYWLQCIIQRSKNTQNLKATYLAIN